MIAVSSICEAMVAMKRREWYRKAIRIVEVGRTCLNERLVFGGSGGP